MINYKLFLKKLRNRILHAFRFRELNKYSLEEKQSCHKCGCHIFYDFDVADKDWEKLPKNWQNTTLCINCFVELYGKNDWIDMPIRFFKILVDYEK